MSAFRLSDDERTVLDKYPEAECVRDDDSREWWVSPWDDDNGAFELGRGYTQREAWGNAARQVGSEKGPG